LAKWPNYSGCQAGIRRKISRQKTEDLRIGKTEAWGCGIFRDEAWFPRMSETKQSEREWMTAVRAVYADLSSLPVARNCTGLADCCRFRLTGRTPYLTRGEALVAAAAWRAAGRNSLTIPDDGSCPFLGSQGRCQIYDGRPFGCRTHFCTAAGGPYARGEVRDLIHRLEDIDRKAGGSGASNLPTAVRQVMDEPRPAKRRGRKG